MEIAIREVVWSEPLGTADDMIAECRSAAPTIIRPSSAGGAVTRKLEARERPRVVVALGGGAARAAAHIGVLCELRRSGLEIAGIAGTSAGSLVGAMFAAGVAEERILERFLEFPRSPLYRKLRRSYVVNKGHQQRRNDPYFRASALEFLSSERIAFLSEADCEDFVRFFVGEDRDIAKLNVPIACLATDLVEGRNVSLTHGSLHEALKASCALPGLFPPVTLDKRVLVDGSVLTEVPIEAAARISGGLPTLAVYLSRPERAPTDFSSSLELGVRTSAIVHRELLREQLDRASLVLSVAVGEYGWLGFGAAREVADVGRATTAAAMSTVMSLVREEPEE